MIAMFYTLTVVTFGTAVPPGQFVPGIMIGSTYGRLVGMFVVNFYKKLNIDEGTPRLTSKVAPLPSESRGGSFPIRHTNSEFVKPVSSKGISLDDTHLSLDDLEMYIDLAPLLNPSPYIVPEDMSLNKVYNLFRRLGVRHISVVPRPSRFIDQEDLPTVELQATSVRSLVNDTSLVTVTLIHLQLPGSVLPLFTFFNVVAVTLCASGDVNLLVLTSQLRGALPF
ncbi:hypothetical protein Ancab_013381 [Ancistrocladus abbreviatus]